jgi:ferric-dicitrate binding protein FerR (iron transport regulator)
MKTEKRLLIHDLMEDDQAGLRREATLLAGVSVMRRRRWRRQGIEALAVVALMSVMAFWARQWLVPPKPSTAANSSVSAPKTPYLTDDQLLALFPNTPVGLATVEGRKVLIFPRRSDQAKYVGRW